MAQIRERMWKHLVQRQANRQGETVTSSDDDARLAFQLEVGPQEGRAPAEVDVLEAGVTHFTAEPHTAEFSRKGPRL